jgi:hypothetical protein
MVLKLGVVASSGGEVVRRSSVVAVSEGALTVVFVAKKVRTIRKQSYCARRGSVSSGELSPKDR